MRKTKPVKNYTGFEVPIKYNIWLAIYIILNIFIKQEVWRDTSNLYILFFVFLNKINIKFIN